MDHLRFFIVFHESIVETCDNFTDAEKRSMLRWVAVNEKIPKKIPSVVPTDLIIREWNLRNHNPFLQMNNMNENSVIQHFHTNPELYEGAKYIGLGQYDMQLDVDKFRALYTSLQSNNVRLGFFPFIYKFEHLFDPFPSTFWNHSFIEPYNAKYGTNHSLQDLVAQGFIPLINCFIIPVSIWKELVEFSIFITPRILKGLLWDIKHLGGTMERVHGLFLLCAILENKFDSVVDFPGLKHH